MGVEGGSQAMCHHRARPFRPVVPRAAKVAHLLRSGTNLEAAGPPRYKDPVASPHRSPFFGALPEHGPWTAVGLTRGQFIAILALSVALFVLVDGPVWAHLRDGHTMRIAVSYGIIPPAVAVALRRNRSARLSLVLGASAVIALVKLLLTAALLVAIALLR
jgi:hypothetical protein